jgi:predicted DNA-binding transcriptional regulator YafY
LPFETEVERLVAPYGLVAKEHAWHLVAARDGQLRVYHVAQVRAVRPSPEAFERPASFDLAAFWSEWCARCAHPHPVFHATVRAAPELVPHLLRAGGTLVPPDGQANGTRLTVPFESFEAARTRLLGWGSAVEVLAPLALRLSVIDFAEQVSRVYCLSSAP